MKRLSLRTLRKPTSRGPWLVVCSVVLAVLVSPFALAAGEGDPLEGGVRNPGNNESQELTRETEIIADTSTYGTRQSNKSDNGGGAIYGCRSKAGGSAANNEPCVRANNLAEGLAFEFETDGNLLGTFTVKNPGDGAKPFTTNATGVATGLNADRVDSKSADEISADGAKVAVAAVQSGLRFARVGDDGSSSAETRRGVASTERTAEGRYTVTFDADVRTCVFQATQVVTNDADFDDPGTIAVRLTGERTVAVSTENNEGTADDSGFHLQATCL